MGYYIAMDRFGNYDLAHHGIKGQQWGIRRFQNEDMTWTAAGKERYGHSKNKDSSKKYSKEQKREKRKKIVKAIVQHKLRERHNKLIYSRRGERTMKFFERNSKMKFYRSLRDADTSAGERFLIAILSRVKR